MILLIMIKNSDVIGNDIDSKNKNGTVTAW